MRADPLRSTTFLHYAREVGHELPLAAQQTCGAPDISTFNEGYEIARSDDSNNGEAGATQACKADGSNQPVLPLGDVGATTDVPKIAGDFLRFSRALTRK
jgi:hypothetical protein